MPEERIAIVAPGRFRHSFVEDPGSTNLDAVVTDGFYISEVTENKHEKCGKAVVFLLRCKKLYDTIKYELICQYQYFDRLYQRNTCDRHVQWEDRSHAFADRPALLQGYSELLEGEIYET